MSKRNKVSEKFIKRVKEDMPVKVPLNWLDVKQAEALGYQKKINFKRAIY